MKNVLSAALIIIVFSSCTKSATSSCKGTRISDCVCTKEYMPVCGCDGKTYSNACEAKCAGIKNWTSGACK